MSRILIVEDEKRIARFLELELQHEGYEVLLAEDGRSGLDKILQDRPDLVILDLMLPEMSGIEVCRRARRETDVPIIMLTAKDDVSDKVMGLDIGADDYMTKPFAIEELLARIRVGLKKHRADGVGAAHEGVLRAGGLELDPVSYEVSYQGKAINLTKKEFDLLHYLMAHAGEAVTREQLLKDVWEYGFAGDTNVVDVYIRYLRQKLDVPHHLHSIHTIRSVGYMFRMDADRDEGKDAQENG
ncbi:MAG: response regulator transcription factor [Clostridia bacterium]|nr:response regulator transcription factor [Clostridia bacterium]